jgi:hypothetical protein
MNSNRSRISLWEQTGSVNYACGVSWTRSIVRGEVSGVVGRYQDIVVGKTISGEYNVAAMRCHDCGSDDLGENQPVRFLA